MIRGGTVGARWIAACSLALVAVGCDRGSKEADAGNATAQAAELLNAADGDMAIVRASGGDPAKARLLVAGKRMATPVAPVTPQAPAAPAEPATPKRTACWTPPAGPNVIDDPDRPISADEVAEIEGATGRPYQQGDTIWGKAEDRCPA